MKLSVTHRPPATKNPQAYANALKILSRSGFPEVVAETLNLQAKQVHAEATRNVKRNFKVRTKYTLGSNKNDRRARGTNINVMFSRVISLSPYLGIHDEGGKREAEGGGRLPIPFTGSARGGNAGKTILTRYRMDKMGTMKKNSRFFMGTPRGRSSGALGIWERLKGGKIRRVRHLTRKSVVLKRTNWFTNAVKKYGTRQYQNAKFVELAERKLFNNLG